MPRMSWTEREPAPALIVRFDRDRLSLWDAEAIARTSERVSGRADEMAAGG